MYRFNYSPVGLSELEYLDRVVSLVKAYGMELMLVVEPSSGTIETIKAHFRMPASRYNGEKGYGLIRYFQVFNEMDIACIKSAGVDGFNLKQHYDLSKLERQLPLFEAALSGLKEGNLNCKTVINFSYLHTGFLDFLVQNAVDFDINGLDWYSNMGDFDRILPKLLDSYRHDIIVCETNWWPDASNDKHNTDTTYLPTIMKQVYRYNHQYGNRIKGVIIYELLDEMNYETSGKFEGEAHFGLIHTDGKGNIGEKKPAYFAVQKLLGGGTVKPTYPSTDSTTAPSSSGGTTKAPTVKPGDNSTTATSTDETGSADTTTLTKASDATTTASGADVTTTTSGSATDTDSDDANTPIWPFVVIPVAVLVIGAGVFLVLKFKFGMFTASK